MAVHWNCPSDVLTVSNNSSVDNSSQQHELVLSSVVREQSSGVLVAERGSVLGSDGADSSRQGKRLHVHYCVDF